MKLKIGQRVIFLVLLCGTVSILILSGISLYGMWGIRQSIVETGTDLGNSAADGSRQALEEQAKQQLNAMAQEKARYTDLKIKNIGDNVTILAREMTKIASNPDSYMAASLAEPHRENAGRFVPQLLYSAAVDKNNPALQREISAAANIQDFLLQLNSASNVIASSYIASQNGFVIMNDKISDRKFADSLAAVPAPYEAFARPWYIKATKEQKLVFTDVVNDINGGGLCIICAAPYTNNDSFAGVVGMGAYLTEINQIVMDTKQGENKFGFILNEKGEVTISPRQEGELRADSEHPVDLRGSENKALAAAAKDMTAGKNGVVQVTLDGEECYLAFAPLSNVSWSFATVISKAEVIAPAVKSRENIIGLTNKTVSAMQQQIIDVSERMWLAAFALLLLVAFAGFKLATRITQPIKVLTDGVCEIGGSGNLNMQLDIRTGDEIETLAASFNTMTKALCEYMDNLKQVTADKERIATELNVATHIQTSMLPSIFPAFPDRKEFDIYATMDPAKEVGGDFYDFFMVDDSHLAVVIADVSGKGVPAALFMVISKTIIKNFVTSLANTHNLALAMRLSNMQLNENNDEMMFVTALVGLLDINTGKFTYVNAGHNPPLIYNKTNQSFSYLQMEKNCVLGIMPDVDFVQQEIKLNSDELMFFYTDGVTEAMDNKLEQYTEQRLLDCLNGLDSELSLQDILKTVKESVQDHAGTAPQSDDITMMALKLSK
ncbi:MAG: SpoIIE family protein phosphatase [Pelosinus sp.]|nr:SpoIIE family protein phosphatase [Pelosinus sp.]